MRTTPASTPRRCPTDFKTFLVLKGLSPVTVGNHLRAVARMTRRAGRLTLESAKAYVADLYQSPTSYSNKRNQITALEHYLAWRGIDYRFTKLRKPKPAVVQVLSEPEITRLVLACRTVHDRAILSLLAYSGVRPKELCHLKVRDVDAASNQLRVMEGKGGTSASIHLSPACVAVLQEYLRAHPRPAEALLFVTTREQQPYSPNALRKLVRRLARRAGITRRVHPYLLRHSLATHMVERGAPLLAVKQQLRHVFLETTWHYVASLGYDPESHFDRFFPKYQ